MTRSVQNAVDIHPYALETIGIAKRFGALQVLNDVSFKLRKKFVSRAIRWQWCGKEYAS
ncbi:hypothetical protein [Methylocucumis oryzae]|uniref:hypothetical protein n=1 Tax=Methylocucumis oryzae TaxID=1632867 RepID=UPI001EF9EE66|nr:hypothetical protein [Methylocucumis oryzae]